MIGSDRCDGGHDRLRPRALAFKRLSQPLERPLEGPAQPPPPPDAQKRAVDHPGARDVRLQHDAGAGVPVLDAPVHVRSSGTAYVGHAAKAVWLLERGHRRPGDPAQPERRRDDDPAASAVLIEAVDPQLGTAEVAMVLELDEIG